MLFTCSTKRFSFAPPFHRRRPQRTARRWRGILARGFLCCLQATTGQALCVIGSLLHAALRSRRSDLQSESTHTASTGDMATGWFWNDRCPLARRFSALQVRLPAAPPLVYRGSFRMHMRGWEQGTSPPYHSPTGDRREAVSRARKKASSKIALT